MGAEIAVKKKERLSADSIAAFRKKIREYYAKNRRDLPWRTTVNPYHILVSEIMLTQTQVERVIEKYNLFLQRFPDFKTLAASSLHDVLEVWQGLGYNRRALLLKKCAAEVIQKYNGKLPQNVESLESLPGIGPYIARAVCAFAYNLPTVFIETNIRTVFIYHFFLKQKKVHDRDIMPLLTQTLDRKNPREWYNALMDYGSFLKKKYGNSNRKSAHYAKQSRFIGSDRQIRGLIVKSLMEPKKITKQKLQKKLYSLMAADKKRFEAILSGLQKDGLVKKINGKYTVG